MKQWLFLTTKFVVSQKETKLKTSLIDCVWLNKTLVIKKNVGNFCRIFFSQLLFRHYVAGRMKSASGSVVGDFCFI